MTYNWTLSAVGAQITGGQGTNAITANFATPFLSVNLTVAASNACGTSTTRILAIKASPAYPGSITGATSVCANQQNVPYSISLITGATSYTWSGPTGSRFSDGVTTSTTAIFTTTFASVTVNFKTTAGDIKVKANNACASSSNKIKTVAITCKTGAIVDPNELNISTSPNPAHDVMMVSFFSNEKSFGSRIATPTFYIQFINFIYYMQLSIKTSAGTSSKFLEFVTDLRSIFFETVNCNKNTAAHVGRHQSKHVIL